MQDSWKIRLLLAMGLLGITFYFLYPSIVYFTLDENQLKEVRQSKDAFTKFIPSWSPSSHMVPGLDLQGGIHMVLGIDIEKAITDKTARALDRLVSFAKDEGINITSSKQTGETTTLQDKAELTFSSLTDLDKFKSSVLKKFSDFMYVSSSGNTVELKIDPSMMQSIKHDAVNQTITTITNRIDKMGVTEPSIARRGDDQVQIQLPGYDDPEQAKSMIGRTAQLQFQMCDDSNTFLKDLKDLPEGAKLIESGYSRSSAGTARDIYLEFHKDKLASIKDYLVNKVPTNLVVKYGNERDGLMRTYTLERKVPLSGEDLIDARVSAGSNMDPRPGVSLSFSPVGAKIFADLTANSIGKRMAIVLEDIVDSAPVINTKIPDGNAFISMGGARSNQELMRDANQLAIVLKSGALPAPVTFREEKSVGPSLGKDSIEEGKIAFLIGTILVIVFMIFYYRVAGIISIIGVVFNMLCILATLSLLGATITMPGIAGLLLTIGVAVDSNVIINERIREELRLGKTPLSAIQTGYQSAMSAILDANITTLIAGIVLWQFGTGPVQNFATMLLIGTVSSVFSAIFITRIFFDMLSTNGQKTLSI
jgi:protein-export membrane protein SecD